MSSIKGSVNKFDVVETVLRGQKGVTAGAAALVIAIAVATICGGMYLVTIYSQEQENPFAGPMSVAELKQNCPDLVDERVAVEGVLMRRGGIAIENRILTSSAQILTQKSADRIAYGVGLKGYDFPRNFFRDRIVIHGVVELSNNSFYLSVEGAEFLSEGPENYSIPWSQLQSSAPKVEYPNLAELSESEQVWNSLKVWVAFPGTQLAISSEVLHKRTSMSWSLHENTTARAPYETRENLAFWKDNGTVKFRKVFTLHTCAENGYLRIEPEVIENDTLLLKTYFDADAVSERVSKFLLTGTIVRFKGNENVPSQLDNIQFRLIDKDVETKRFIGV